MAAIYRISEFKEEYKDHYPFPNSIPRMIFPKIGDHLKVSQVILLSNNQQRCYLCTSSIINQYNRISHYDGFCFYILSTPIVEFLYILKPEGYIPSITEIREKYQNPNDKLPYPPRRPTIHRLYDTLEKVHSCILL